MSNFPAEHSHAAPREEAPPVIHISLPARAISTSGTTVEQSMAGMIAVTATDTPAVADRHEYNGDIPSLLSDDVALPAHCVVVEHSQGLLDIPDALNDRSAADACPHPSPPSPSVLRESASRDPSLPRQRRERDTIDAQPTGWVAVGRALSKFDEQEVNAYKEDIDSLLVFAGLYSAVLTAFIIVSYPLLQEDTASETLQVLRFIANQTATYTILDGQLITASAAPPISTPFQPSITAIRVNILWFASLVTSLSTASIGIMVKQWLRAYVAFASSSPQGQLRIRQYRRKGLEIWKVYGIASILPLLIQLSLAFFFAGLCFFTNDIHPSIGLTVLPLVCGWAFLLAAFTLSPIFSARCPYKAPGLASLVCVLRARVYQRITNIMRPHFLHTATYTTMCIVVLCYAPLHCAVLFPLRLLRHRLDSERETWAVEKAIQRYFGIVVDAVDGLRCSRYLESNAQEETDVLRDASKDLIILAAADTIQANDGLLGSTMRAALEQSTVDWADAVEFLIQVIANRVPLLATFSNEATLIDVNMLSMDASDAITSLFHSFVIKKVPKAWNGKTQADWESEPKRYKALEWAMYISISMNKYLPLRLCQSFDRCLQDSEELAKDLDYGHIGFDSLLVKLRLTCIRVIGDEGNMTLETMVNYLDQFGSFHAILHQARQPSQTKPCPRTCHLLNEASHRLLYEMELKCKALPDTQARGHGDHQDLHDAMALVFELRGITSFSSSFEERQIYDQERIRPLMKTLLSLGAKEKLQNIVRAWIFQPALATIYYPEWELNCMGGHDGEVCECALVVTVLHKFILGSEKELRLDISQLLNLSFIALSSVIAHGRSDPDADTYNKNCDSIFLYIGNAMSEQPRNFGNYNPLSVRRSHIKGRQVRRVATQCWSLIEKLYGQVSGSTSIASGAQDEHTLAVNYFCLMLRALHPGPNRYERVKMLEAMTSDDRERIEREGRSAYHACKVRPST